MKLLIGRQMAGANMTDHDIVFSDAQMELLEKVREQQGLANVQQAAEWLAKSALRKAATRASSRGRALYPITNGRPWKP